MFVFGLRGVRVWEFRVQGLGLRVTSAACTAPSTIAIATTTTRKG